MEASGELHSLAALTLGKELPVPFGKQVVWAPELVWIMWRIKNSLLYLKYTKCINKLK
jgi:hypothetical protein